MILLNMLYSLNKDIIIIIKLHAGRSGVSLYCLWFSAVCFGVTVSVTFHLYIFVHTISSLVWVAVWSPFGNELPTRLTKCSRRVLTICNFSYFSFRF